MSVTWAQASWNKAWTLSHFTAEGSPVGHDGDLHLKRAPASLFHASNNPPPSPPGRPARVRPVRQRAATDGRHDGGRVGVGAQVLHYTRGFSRCVWFALFYGGSRAGLHPEPYLLWSSSKTALSEGRLLASLLRGTCCKWRRYLQPGGTPTPKAVGCQSRPFPFSAVPFPPVPFTAKGIVPPVCQRESSTSRQYRGPLASLFPGCRQDGRCPGWGRLCCVVGCPACFLVRTARHCGYVDVCISVILWLQVGWGCWVFLFHLCTSYWHPVCFYLMLCEWKAPCPSHPNACELSEFTSFLFSLCWDKMPDEANEHSATCG